VLLTWLPVAVTTVFWVVASIQEAGEEAAMDRQKYHLDDWSPAHILGVASCIVNSRVDVNLGRCRPGTSQTVMLLTQARSVLAHCCPAQQKTPDGPTGLSSMKRNSGRSIGLVSASGPEYPHTLGRHTGLEGDAVLHSSWASPRPQNVCQLKPPSFEE
jgi:hypothetical protein